MRFRLILSIFFIIATTFTALHEIEHVKNHDSFTCQICIVDNHTVSGDIITKTEEFELFTSEAILPQQHFASITAQTRTYHSRAPPFLS